MKLTDWRRVWSHFLWQVRTDDDHDFLTRWLEEATSPLEEEVADEVAADLADAAMAELDGLLNPDLPPEGPERDSWFKYNEERS